MELPYFTTLSTQLLNFNTSLTLLYIICAYIYNVKQKQIDMKTQKLDLTLENRMKEIKEREQWLFEMDVQENPEKYGLV